MPGPGGRGPTPSSSPTRSSSAAWRRTSSTTHCATRQKAGSIDFSISRARAEGRRFAARPLRLRRRRPRHPAGGSGARFRALLTAAILPARGGGLRPRAGHSAAIVEAHGGAIDLETPRRRKRSPLRHHASRHGGPNRSASMGDPAQGPFGGPRRAPSSSRTTAR